MDRVLEITHMDQVMDKTTEAVFSAQVQQIPELKNAETEILAFLRKYLSFKALEKDIRLLYADKFSEQELQELADFYESPVGKKSLEVMPTIATESMQIAQRKMAEHSEEFKKIVTKAIKKSKK